jgi:hypothetical protein
MGKLLALDRRRRIEPVALQDPRADELLPGMDEETKMRSWHLVRDDGRVTSAGGGKLDPLYYAVANRRTFFGKFVTEGAKRRARARIAARSQPAPS